MSTPSSAAQTEIQSLLQSLVDNGTERGLQLTAFHNGKIALDAWAGAMSPDGPPVKGDTLFPIYSTGKGVTATVIHLLAERRKLDYDAPIAKYWPKFAANGKENLTVRHALNHTSGLAYLPRDLSLKEFHDYGAMCRLLEGATPATPPGHEILYHAVTYGWILAELAHRADGRPFTQIVSDDICRPLHITDMYFGIPDSVDSRIATVEAAPPEPPATKPERVTIPDCIVPLADWMNKPESRRAMIPGSNGIMTTRALAKHYAALLPGGVNGIELLPPSRIKLATELQRPLNKPDARTHQALGYVTGNIGPIFGDRPTAFGHQGYGGSYGFADPSINFAYAFSRNRFHNADSPALIMKTVLSVLGIA